MYYILIISQIILIVIVFFIGLQFKPLKKFTLQLSKELEVKKEEISEFKKKYEAQMELTLHLEQENLNKEDLVQSLQKELADKEKETKSLKELLAYQDRAKQSENYNVNPIQDIVLPLEVVIRNNEQDTSLITQLKEIQKQTIHLIPFTEIKRTTHEVTRNPKDNDLSRSNTNKVEENLSNSLSNKAISIINDHLSEPDFSVEELSSILGVSRVGLYKRIVAETGETPIKLIRNLRLELAYSLLQSQVSINEVIRRTGFNTPKYFVRYFKEKYGITPQSLLHNA